MSALRPQHNYCLVEVDVPRDEERESGIIVPETTKSVRPATGLIIAAGPDVQGFEVGQRVLFPPYIGLIESEHPAMEYVHEGVNVLFILDEQILAVIEGE